MKKGKIALLAGIIIIGLLQFIRPEPVEYKKIEEAKALVGVPKRINTILQNSCFNCHSSSAQLEWYDKLTPANFLVNSHIRKGRKALNFSNWENLPPAKRRGALYYGLNKVLANEMPPSSYTLVHPSAKLNEEEIGLIKNYLISITPRTVSNHSPVKKPGDSLVKKIDQERLGGKQNSPREKNYDWVKPAPNGIAYIPNYRDWKVISTTDRFDNGTIRIIFANDAAVAAIQNKETNPWPDGSIFAKVLWKQKISPEGIVSTGEFVHVEYMIKDATKYAETEGWGWARWKGENLVPHGKSAAFSNACIKCHNPVQKYDNVFTKPLNLIKLQKQ